MSNTFPYLKVNVLAGGADINGPILGSILRKRIRIEGTTLRTRSTEVSVTARFWWLLPPAYVVRGKVLFSQVSVCQHLGGGVPTFRVVGGDTYSALDRRGVPTLARVGGVPTQLWVGGGVPTLARVGAYLPWPGWGVPTLAGVGGGVPTLAGVGGNLPR